MTEEASIIELARWFQTPPGAYLLEWEQARLDAAVADLFGFHALQLGLPELQGLRANRMPHRWLGLDHLVWPAVPAVQETGADSSTDTGPNTLLALDGVALHCDFDALPFEANSLDLVILPHALELARDPHHALREVERVLRPEGRVVILGFNPASLWGLRQNLGRAGQRFRGGKAAGGLFLPRAGDFIGYWRLRDWLRLLSFEVEGAQFGCYSPPLRTERWLQRWRWIEPIGERWWPVLGAVYFMVAVKRVRGMRLVGLLPKTRRAGHAAPAVALNQHHKDSCND
jgi:SAM-dependent methyltransferase